MWWIFDTIHKISDVLLWEDDISGYTKTNKYRPIEDEDWKQIWDYEVEEDWFITTVKPRKKIHEFTQSEKILIWMSWNYKNLWKASDFQHSPFFIGYEASARLSGLFKKWLIDKWSKEWRFSTHLINEKWLEKVKQILSAKI